MKYIQHDTKINPKETQQSTPAEKLATTLGMSIKGMMTTLDRILLKNKVKSKQLTCSKQNKNTRMGQMETVEPKNVW